jgi:hypothetical protein
MTWFIEDGFLTPFVCILVQSHNFQEHVELHYSLTKMWVRDAITPLFLRILTAKRYLTTVNSHAGVGGLERAILPDADGAHQRQRWRQQCRHAPMVVPIPANGNDTWLTCMATEVATSSSHCV